MIFRIGLFIAGIVLILGEGVALYWNHAPMAAYFAYVIGLFLSSLDKILDEK